jgi:hypothetical protein
MLPYKAKLPEINNMHEPDWTCGCDVCPCLTIHLLTKVLQFHYLAVNITKVLHDKKPTKLPSETSQYTVSVSLVRNVKVMCLKC